MHDGGGAATESVRARMLRKGVEITTGDRNKSYGDPVVQLGLAGEFKRIARENAVRRLTDAEWEAVDMVLTKLSRSLIGADPGEDTFVDMATYAAIYGECYVRRNEDGPCVHSGVVSGDRMQEWMQKTFTDRPVVSVAHSADAFDAALAAHKENY